jgi:predicted nucleic acid-binding protein
MIAKAFVDADIFVYARDTGAGSKHARARELIDELWRSRHGRTSIQVLDQYWITVTRKLEPGLPPDQAWEDIAALQAWEPVPLDWNLLARGHELFRQHPELTWKDAMIFAAAQVSGCHILYTEEIEPGQSFGGVRVVNPFAEAAAAPPH